LFSFRFACRTSLGQAIGRPVKEGGRRGGALVNVTLPHITQCHNRIWGMDMPAFAYSNKTHKSDRNDTPQSIACSPHCRQQFTSTPSPKTLHDLHTTSAVSLLVLAEYRLSAMRAIPLLPHRAIAVASSTTRSPMHVVGISLVLGISVPFTRTDVASPAAFPHFVCLHSAAVEFDTCRSMINHFDAGCI
jgi:hypothetical protein